MPENTEAVAQYAHEVLEAFFTGHAKEHGYRPQLAKLLSSFDDVLGVNDPKRSTFGNPDFVMVKKSNNNIILGYAEAKDVDVNLDKAVDSDQLRRYAGYDKLLLTNYHEFRFFRNGEEYTRTSIGRYTGASLQFDPTSYAHLYDELNAFLELPPEKIKSGRRLSEIMGGKARRIRDNVNTYLHHGDNESNRELEKIFEMMKDLLVHDLSKEKFADMYAQTLVYGLFVARYNDPTPETFTRGEARDLVPASNPFLREFFDHIVGPRFDKRLSHIVDELCEVFSVSDVEVIVHKHLRLFEVANDKDPIIHFYEDFLKEYDPAERKKMGAYYTPVPVVKFIVKYVDRILKNDFGLSQGLADTSKRTITVERQAMRRKMDVHRVQILDPATGTATFLNEAIKYIHSSFIGQEGRWPSYAEQDLLPRLYGFELMMAPYTIAHLKLGMTLQESGVKDLKQRLGVYLTNTLEEGIKAQPDLFTFGLAEVVSEEATEAERIKSEKPVMVIVGNPPYAGHSSNVTKYAQSLIEKYKKDIPELKRPAQAKWLSDDYVKFIAFAEDMINKSGAGIVAMITNHAYLDNSTFRGMRLHLAKSFNKIYILDLHGNSLRKETGPNGEKDENVFDIQQGVSIIIATKTGSNPALAEIFHSEMFGNRKSKFDRLNKGLCEWRRLEPDRKNVYFVPKNTEGEGEYSKFVGIAELFSLSGSPAPGIVTTHDEFAISWSPEEAIQKVEKLIASSSEAEARQLFRLCGTSQWNYERAKKELSSEDFKQKVKRISYRPFDQRWTIYDRNVAVHRRERVMNHLVTGDNVALVLSRQCVSDWRYVFVSKHIGDLNLTGTAGRFGSGFYFPLYIHHGDGTSSPNLEPKILKKLTKKLKGNYDAIDIFDYIYAILHSNKYRLKYNEFLKSDFPRVPVPESDEQFSKLAKLGNRLRKLHLMETESSFNEVTYPEYGGNLIEKVEYTDNKVWINSSQYFGNVPEVAWNFYIGGYQPAQKWLKDRRSRPLTNQEIEHYERMITILLQTDKIMNEIEESWQP